METCKLCGKELGIEINKPCWLYLTDSGDEHIHPRCRDKAISAAIEAKHAAEKTGLIAAREEERDKKAALWARVGELEFEIATLRAKMATMVCGRCKGDGYDPATGWDWVNNQYITLTPCPVCQPKKEG
jgi:hypothetical protein